MALLDRLTGTATSAAKLSDLNPLIDAINVLAAKVDSVRADHDALKADLITLAATREKRIADLEAYAQNNSRRIDAMEIRYNAVVDEMEAIANNLTVAVADLTATDEASGWKQWKEQQEQQRGATP